MTSINPSTSVLFLHPPGLEDQVAAFLLDFTTSTSASPGPSAPTSTSTNSSHSYHISNKYYSTTIHLRPLAVPSDVQGPEVFEEALEGVGGLAWVFSHAKDIRPIPPLLQALAIVQPDIQLAIHIHSPTNDTSSTSPQIPPSATEPEIDAENHTSQSSLPIANFPAPSWNNDHVDRAHDIFANLSMDFIDLAPPPTTSQDDESNHQGREDAFEEIKQALEVHMWPGMIRKSSSAEKDAMPLSHKTETEEEDDIDHILSVAPSIHRDNVDRDGFIKLEDWLNLNEAGPESGLDKEGRKEDGFEDDFAPFQSANKVDEGGKRMEVKQATGGGSSRTVASKITAPSAQGKSGEDEKHDLNIDPSTLFQHLQTVRTELSSLSNEDERRTRAAKEVLNIFSGMGIDLDLGLNELDGEGGASSGGTGEMGRVGGALEMGDFGFDDGEAELVERVMKMTKVESWGDFDDDGVNRSGEDLAELMEALGVKDED